MSKKHQIRAAFRNAVFGRDGYKCAVCGLIAPRGDVDNILDAHHITSREFFPNGGYIKENGISLCKVGNNCHFKAEMWLLNGTGEDGFQQETLYAKIGSNREMASNTDMKL